MYGWAESEPGEVINEEDQLSITDSMEIGSLGLLYIIKSWEYGELQIYFHMEWTDRWP